MRIALGALVLIGVLTAITPAQSHGILRLALHSWKYEGNTDCDPDTDKLNAKCDPQFSIEVSRIGNIRAIYYESWQKDHAENTNAVLFTDKIGTWIHNPLRIMINDNTGSVLLKIITFDFDTDAASEAVNDPVRQVLITRNNSGSVYMSQHGLAFSYAFVCDSDSSDTLCNIDCLPQDDATNGHFVCDATGRKHCLSGWVNPDRNCTEAHPCAKGPCGSNGVCTPVNETSYTCQCKPGFRGDACTDYSAACAALRCTNGATCEEKPSGAVCLCRPGYSGTRCITDRERCKAESCLNGGTCSEVYGGIACTCQNGFAGAQCQLDFNECLRNPCLNGGTCVNAERGFRCDCPSGLTGDLCQNDINECSTGLANCPNGFRCSNIFGGHKCMRVDFNDCANSPCVNGGVCLDRRFHFVCDCPPGFGGPKCETVARSYAMQFE